MSKNISYNLALYKISPERIRALTLLDEKQSTGALAKTWGILILLAHLAHSLRVNGYYFVWIPLLFIIAGRQGALLQLVHEASHQLLSKNRMKNDFLAKWFCAFPLGVFVDGYFRGHRQHHAHVGTPLDPPADTEKYRVVDATNPRLYLLLLKDLLGFTALEVFFKYGERDTSTASKSRTTVLTEISIVQGFVLAILFQFSLVDYLLFWLLPAISCHMFLMRIRGIAEHGLSKQLGIDVSSAAEGTLYTRSFLIPSMTYQFPFLVTLEKILIGSLNVHYHHEHHLLPTVPFYRLPELHSLIGSQVRLNNHEVYELGYFSAAFRNFRHQTVYEAESH